MEKRPEYSSDLKPRRMASWWNEVSDLLWPDITVQNRIKAKAKAFHDAGIDTAINYGLHMRFDFSDYFHNYHGYMNQVCEELHKYGIKFIDHYSCNLVERPRDEEEFKKLHSMHRHHILLHKDWKAAEYAAYEGHKFQDICEVDLRDGSRGYTANYQAELFCHNNPGFLDMHKKYLERLVKEVDFDAIEVDDMCEYGGLAVCGCEYCRARFKRDYGHDLPSLDDKDFWGNTDLHPYLWGNYKNPKFRDWLKMRTDSILDHIKMVKEVVKDKPMMTCCSGTGPIALNSIALDLERCEDELDFVMLENCGITCNTTNWIVKDAEALQQKDIAEKMGNAPAVALSYTVYKDGGYLGWALARFWGVGNWSSTINGRLTDEPTDLLTVEEIIKPCNVWEGVNSPIDPFASKDILNVRLVSNRYNRDMGWRDEKGVEAWTKINGWAMAFVKNNVSYRFVRYRELADDAALMSQSTSIVMESNASVSNQQFEAIKKYLANGGTAIVCLPFGTYDENGFEREVPFSNELIANGYKNLHIVESSVDLQLLIEKGVIEPAVKLICGDKRRVARARTVDGRLVVHIMNTGIIGVPHKWVTTIGNNRIMDHIENLVSDHIITFDVVGKNLPVFKECVVKSPEFSDVKRAVKVEKISNGYRVTADLSGSGIYAVIE